MKLLAAANMFCSRASRNLCTLSNGPSNFQINFESKNKNKITYMLYSNFTVVVCYDFKEENIIEDTSKEEKSNNRSSTVPHPEPEGNTIFL